jgi:hypothetical protein
MRVVESLSLVQIDQPFELLDVSERIIRGQSNNVGHSKRFCALKITIENIGFVATKAAYAMLKAPSFDNIVLAGR